MYHLYSKNNIKINHHYCNTPQLAKVVKDYIDGRHSSEVIIEKINDSLVYFDMPGMKIINKALYNVKIGKIETRIDDIGALIWVLNNKKICFEKGFCRINSFVGNICLSELEYLETMDYIDNNNVLLSEMCEEASDIIEEMRKKNNGR